MKKIGIAVLLAVGMTMLLAGTAFADMATHGGYMADTDACAGCHRAHTSFSGVGRTNYKLATRTDDGSALLVGSATNMKQFCLTCHGANAPGASTDVITGVFSAASGPSGAINADKTYHTNSVDGQTLNGGSFGKINAVGVTSQHDCDINGVGDPLWGTGASAANFAGFTCTSCHDPHGSTNYRLLKDKVGPDSAVVGGYDTGGNVKPYVLSAERGYPAAGWAKSSAMNDMGNYYPDFTTPRYRASNAVDLADGKGMSGWCSGCHTQYDVQTGTRTSLQTPAQADAAGKYNYGNGENVWANKPAFGAGSAPTVGDQVRHRHPVNMTLESGYGLQNSLAQQVNVGSALWSGSVDANHEVIGTPLELAYNKTYTGTQIANSSDDVLGCLTCHKAHGTRVQMNGWALGRLAHNDTAVNPDTPEWTVEKGDDNPAAGGVQPNASTSLLRMDNRGVCQNCHNK